jgi:hypothetical protein
MIVLIRHDIGKYQCQGNEHRHGKRNTIEIKTKRCKTITTRYSRKADPMVLIKENSGGSFIGIHT